MLGELEFCRLLLHGSEVQGRIKVIVHESRCVAVIAWLPAKGLASC